MPPHSLATDPVLLLRLVLVLVSGLFAIVARQLLLLPLCLAPQTRICQCFAPVMEVGVGWVGEGWFVGVLIDTCLVVLPCAFVAVSHSFQLSFTATWCWRLLC